MKTVKYEVTYREQASRLELVVRWVWSIPSFVVLALLGILSAIAAFLQFFHVLILGKRNRTLYDWTLMYVAYYVKWASYFYLTDERSPIMPG
ncbi:DUF4389 domain-containing protein [Candidatus Micrarchaeota archaeon]|nr:DUF4389 domain-containing protein [Candidatus Micrarchaeota archaeon]